MSTTQTSITPASPQAAQPKGSALKRYLYGLDFVLMRAVSRVPSQTVRRLFYQLHGLHLGQDSCIHMGAEIRSFRNVRIMDNSSIGHDCILDGRGGLTIGSNVNISSQAAIWTAQHDYTCPEFATIKKPVVIHDRAWISFRATILPGVTVGEGAVVGAGAIVTRDVDPYTVVTGIPAKVVRQRPSELTYEIKPNIPFC